MPLVATTTHPGLGRLVTLSGLSARPLKLTPREASTIAAALAAVRDGRSTVPDVYLSPIACDDEFHALVEPDGLRCGDRLLPWDVVAELSAALEARAAETV